MLTDAHKVISPLYSIQYNEEIRVIFTFCNDGGRIKFYKSDLKYLV